MGDYQRGGGNNYTRGAAAYQSRDRNDQSDYGAAPTRGSYGRGGGRNDFGANQSTRDDDRQSYGAAPTRGSYGGGGRSTHEYGRPAYQSRDRNDQSDYGAAPTRGSYGRGGGRNDFGANQSTRDDDRQSYGAAPTRGSYGGGGRSTHEYGRPAYQSRDRNDQSDYGAAPTRGSYGGGGGGGGRNDFGENQSTRDDDRQSYGAAPTRGSYGGGGRSTHEYGRPQHNDSNIRNPRGGGAATGGYAPTRGAMSSGGGGYDRSSNNDYPPADRGYSNRGQENGFPPSTRGGRAPYGGDNERQIRPYNNQADSSYDYSRRDGPPSNDGYGSSGRGGFMAPSLTRGSFGTGRGGTFNAGGGSRYEDRRDDNNSGYGGFGSGGNSGYGGLSGGGGYGGLGSTQFDADGIKIRTAENHAPRDYKPVERNIEDIFEEDKEDVKKNTATIFDADADVTVEEAADDMNCETWAEMNLHDSIMDNIRNSDYIKPRKIQARTIPYVLEGYDVKCQGETGSGKTAAFLIPIVQKLIEQSHEGQLPRSNPICVIVAPTRELVSQIYDQAKKFTNKTTLTVARAYGEYAVRSNLADIRAGCNILVACIGRLMHFIRNGEIQLRDLKYLVLDEADRLLMENFNSDVLQLFQWPEMPKGENRQTLLFSATLRDPRVMELTKEYLREKSVLITVQCQSNKRVQYKVYAVPNNPSKFKYLVRYMKRITEENGGETPRTLIFVNRKVNTDRVAIECTNNQFPATTIHGDRGQHLREEALRSFRSGKTKCLVATDVCARGVDIKDMDHVINYDLPSQKDDFVQRCGRTGRVKSGVAMSFYLEDEDRGMSGTIAEVIQQNEQEPPQFLNGCVSANDYNFGEGEITEEASAYGSNNTNEQPYRNNEEVRSRSNSAAPPGFEGGPSRSNQNTPEPIVDQNADDGWN